MFEIFGQKNKEIEYLKEEVKGIRKQLDVLQNENEQLNRIIHNSKYDEITYKSFDPYEGCMLIPIHLSSKSRKVTYIYKDFREYKIDGLMLHDAEFKNKTAEEVIHVIDKVCDGDSFTVSEYTVDLNAGIFIQEK